MQPIIAQDDANIGVILTPRSGASHIAPPNGFAALWQREAIATAGRPATINVTASNAAIPTNAAPTGLCIIKEGGEDFVFLGAKHAAAMPFAQRVLDYEYQHNPEAHQRQMLILIAIQQPIVGQPLVKSAGLLHAHPPLNRQDRRYLESIGDRANEMKNTHYYIFASDDRGTQFVTAPIDLADIDAAGQSITNAGKYPIGFQAAARETTLFTSLHAHHSPIATSENSAPRGIALIVSRDPYANHDQAFRSETHIALMGSGSDHRRNMLAAWRENTVKLWPKSDPCPN